MKSEATPGREAPRTPISPVATREDLIAMIHNRDALVSDLKEALGSARLAAKSADEGWEPGAGLPTSQLAKYKTGAELDAENAAAQRANIKRQIDDATYIGLHKGNYGLKHYLSDEQKRILSDALSATGNPKPPPARCAGSMAVSAMIQ